MASLFFPVLGVILSNALYFSSTPAIVQTSRRGTLGSLNPLPLSLMVVSTVSWMCYALAVPNGFIVASNLPGAVAAVHFVVASAVKYDVDDGVFATELEQLGLPRENAAAILRPYRESKGALRATFAAGTFRAAPTACAGWTADRAAGSAALRLSGPDLRVDVGADKLAVLLHELGQVKAMMDANQE